MEWAAEMDHQGLSAFQDFPGENQSSLRVCRQSRMASKGPSASASPENSSAGGPSGSSNGAGESGGQDSTFECNICLDTAKDAVISLCGHLFWSVPLPPSQRTHARLRKLVALDSFGVEGFPP